MWHQRKSIYICIFIKWQNLFCFAAVLPFITWRPCWAKGCWPLLWSKGFLIIHLAENTTWQIQMSSCWLPLTQRKRNTMMCVPLHIIQWSKQTKKLVDNMRWYVEKIYKVSKWMYQTFIPNSLFCIIIIFYIKKEHIKHSYCNFI